MRRSPTQLEFPNFQFVTDESPERDAYFDDVCECAHRRFEHALSAVTTTRDGPCKRCLCQRFLLVEGPTRTDQERH